MLSQAEIQDLVTEYFADDLELPTEVSTWSSDDLRAFLESGGEVMPESSPAAEFTVAPSSTAVVDVAATDEQPVIESANPPSPTKERASTSSPPPMASPADGCDHGLGTKIGGFFGRIFGRK